MGSNAGASYEEPLVMPPSGVSDRWEERTLAWAEVALFSGSFQVQLEYLIFHQVQQEAGSPLH